ncbi:hypothetical protein PP359_05310 [Sphingomonas sp. BLCC-B65]|nr:hypothetical protein [Sphingomonas sp. BLCC-B65]
MSEHPLDRVSPREAASRGHVRAHARGLSEVALASVFGVIASFVFQVASARYLAPTDFGLLSAFLAVVGTAAIGSSSLQNITAVQTASLMRETPNPVSRRRIPRDALILGIAAGAAVAAAAPTLAASLGSSSAMILAAAVSIPLSFFFADALGLLQGAGRVSQAVWWSTASLLLRLAILGVGVLLGWGLGGAVGAVVCATAISVVGAAWSARGIARPTLGVFSRSGAAIVVLTVAFAWLTSSDILFLRAADATAVAGSYAAATVLVKAGFLVPSTLSLYLLPRFIRVQDDRRLSRLGVLVTLALSIGTSLAMTLVFALLGPWIIHTLYGTEFTLAGDLLVPVCLAYLPWMAAQGMLIKMTSTASMGGALALVAAVIVQSIAFMVVAPDIPLMLTWLGAIGAAALVAFLVIDSTGARRAERNERNSHGRAS